jgi:hypothetical protein
MENKEKSVFETLNYIDVNDKTEQKNGLTYLSWAWAWAEVKKRYPDANYTIYETTNPQGYVCNYFTDGRTCWVKTGVTINGLEHIEELPVMDYKNKSIPLEQVTSFDVNKTIQRSITKSIGKHGCGLFLYTSEDLPEEPKNPMTDEQKKIIDSLDEAKKQVIIKVYKTLDLTSEQASKVINDLKKKGLI